MAVENGSQFRLYSQNKMNYSILVQYLTLESGLYAIAAIVPDAQGVINLVNHISFLIYALAILVAIILIFILTKHITKPLEEMQVFTRKIASQTYQPLQIKTGDELEDVANSLNDMANEIERYQKKLEEKKPVVFCGDLNVAHKEIDLKNPKTNRNNAGFSDQEREKMTALLSSGFTDSFRHLYPDATGVYSWWSYRFNARKNNAGWRIDYFIVSDRLRDKIRRAEILTDVEGSDHCPVLLEVDI